jgi:type I restriction enzyme S subunit
LAARELSSLTDGPFGSNLKTSHYTKNGPRVIRLQNIGNGRFVDEQAHISLTHFGRLRRHEAKAGDIVAAMLGADLPRACLVPEWVGPAIVKADCVRLRVDSALALPAFLALGLNSKGVRKQAEKFVHGVGRPRLGLRFFRALRLPVAPIKEQRRIVDILDSHFTRLDDAEATLERVKRNLERYRASVLQAAIEGRLVPTEAELAQVEGRSYETASTLVRRLSPEAIEVDGAAGEVPLGWTKVRLGSIAQVRLGRQRSPSRSVGENMRPYMRAANVTWSGINTQDVKEMDFTPREFEAFALRRGDILLSEASGSPNEVGKPAIWNEQIPGCCFQNTLVRVRAAPCLVPFLHLHFLSNAVGGAFSRSSKGVGIHHLSAGTMDYWPTRIPPLAEQCRIVARVEDSLSVVRAVQQAIKADELRCARLRQGLLAMAFQGRLVDQDPTDEPASALIDRVRAERMKATSVPEAPRRRGHPRKAVKK